MSNIQTGAERMPHDLSHLGFLAGQIGRLRSEERRVGKECRSWWAAQFYKKTTFAGSHPQKHHDFFMGFNAGGGVEHVRYAEVESVQNPGGAAIIRIGGAVVNNVLLGAEVNVCFFKQKTAYEVGLGIPAEPLFRSWRRAYAA